MKRVLAIDPGANFGWAIRLPKKVMFGTEHFDQFAGVDGRAHAKFDDWLGRFLYASKPEIIVSEAPIFRGVNSEYLYGFSSILQMHAFRMNIPTYRVNLMTIKASVAGHGHADKERMIAAMRELGYDPGDEHQADALAILTFYERNNAGMEEFKGKTISLKRSALNTIKYKKKAKR
jgi:crossover junction endodeoxyribonuclease RuvC